MSTLIASRVYEKRATEKSTWDGRIGKVEFMLQSEAPIVATMDGKPLPANSVTYLLHFALQALQDAYAGSASLTEGIADFEKKRDRILSGTLGQREGGVSDEVKIGRKFAQAAFVKKYGEADWKALDEAAQTAKLDDILAKNEAHFKTLVAAEIDRLKKAAEEKAKLAAIVNAEATLEI